MSLPHHVHVCMSLPHHHTPPTQASSLPPTPKGIINGQLLSWLPQGATVINGARGAHVDTPALLRALDEGQVGSCLLDVFETEPLPGGDPLWGHPGVRITPHVASVTNIEVGVRGGGT